jgi:hypothetical protein
MTTNTLIDAAVRLADILAAENVALVAMDLAGAAKLLGEKQAATANLSAAQAATLFAPAGMKEVAGRLNDLADENRRLLERAIAVQKRVLGTVARAAQTANPQPQYGPGGVFAVQAPAAWALRANA